MYVMTLIEVSSGHTVRVGQEDRNPSCAELTVGLGESLLLLVAERMRAVCGKRRGRGDRMIGWIEVHCIALLRSAQNRLKIVDDELGACERGGGGAKDLLIQYSGLRIPSEGYVELTLFVHAVETIEACLVEIDHARRTLDWQKRGGRERTERVVVRLIRCLPRMLGEGADELTDVITNDAVELDQVGVSVGQHRPLKTSLGREREEYSPPAHEGLVVCVELAREPGKDLAEKLPLSAYPLEERRSAFRFFGSEISCSRHVAKVARLRCVHNKSAESSKT